MNKDDVKFTPLKSFCFQYSINLGNRPERRVDFSQNDKEITKNSLIDLLRRGM
jgi:hypothetical protein